MGRSLPLDPTASPAHAFAHELRQLRTAAGEPSFDAMAVRGTWSKTQLHAATTGKSFPTWSTTEAFLRACKVPDDKLPEWKQRWDQHEVDMTVFKTATQHEQIEEASTQLPRRSRQVPLLLALLAGVLACVLTALIAGTAAYWLAKPEQPETGDDPMTSGCTGDALLVNTATIEGLYRLDLFWSTKCLANWGRITRLDRKEFGNRIAATVYGSYQQPPPAQHANGRDIKDVYTPIIIVGDDPTATACVTGTIWVGAADTSVNEPVCR